MALTGLATAVARVIRIDMLVRRHDFRTHVRRVEATSATVSMVDACRSDRFAKPVSVGHRDGSRQNR